MNDIVLETSYSQWDLLNHGYNVCRGIDGVGFDSRHEDEKIYIQNYNNSWFESKPYVIKAIREHDLVMLRRLSNSNVLVPHYIHHRNVGNYMGSMLHNVEYLLKTFESARSVGQMFVNKYNIISIIDYAKGHSWEEFNNKYDVDISTCNDDVEKAKLHSDILEGDFFLMKVEVFNEEYRILYFRDTPSENFIIERRKGYQVNSKEKRKHKCVDLNKTHLTKHILEWIKDFGDEHDSPFLSFDVYVKKSGEIGIFEYSTQFGIEYDEKTMNKLYLQFNNAIDKEIREMKN